MSNEHMERLQEEYEEGLFRLLMAKYAEEYGEKLLSDNEALKTAEEFSPTPEATRRFDKAMDKAFRKHKSAKAKRIIYKFSIKFAAVFISLLIVFSITVFAVEDMRIAVLNFLIGFDQEYTSIRLDPSKGNNVIGDNLVVSWADAYVPTYMPEGYKIVKLTNTPNLKRITYENQEGLIIIYSEFSDSAEINIDTEDAKAENITINGFEAILVAEGEIVSVTWTNGEQIFLINSELSRDELIKISESVKYIQ